MRGQINDTAYLHGGGNSLQVTGWVDFDADEKSATVTVVLTQSGSRAEGESGNTPKGKRAWAAELQADAGANFLPGPALATATAIVDTQAGKEDYPEGDDPPWARYITLAG